MASSGSTSVTVTSWDTLKFSWSEQSQSVADNTTTITWKLELVAGTYGRISSSVSKSWSVTVNGTSYSGKNSIAISNDTTKTLASGTTTIPHNSDGTKSFSYSFTQTFNITFNDASIGSKSGSGTGTLDTIPRKSSMSVSNGTLDISQTITVTRQSSSFTHSIKAVCGKSTLYINANGSTSTSEVKHSDCSISFTPPLTWASQNTTGTAVSVTFTIITYNGTTNIGSNTKTVSYSIPAKLTPSCSIEVTDPTNILATYGSYVEGLSKFKIVVKPTLSYDSPIASYKTTINGINYTAASFTTDFINKSGTVTISTTVTDRRGRTGSTSTTISVIKYSPPSISKLSVKRCTKEGTEGEPLYIDNDQGDHICAVFSASVTSLNNKNGLKYYLEYKKTGAGVYETVDFNDDNNPVYSVTDVKYGFEADTGSSYDVRLIAKDNFNETTRVTTASTAYTLMNWNSVGNGMGIGKVSEYQNVLDIGMRTRFYGGILHVVLEPLTNLDDVRTPNTYIGADISTNKYSSYYNGESNFPLTSGTFTLEVVGMGEAGQVKQKLIYCHKTLAKTWERIYYASSWGNWVCVSDFDGQLLWEGVYYMSASQRVELAEPVSKQRSGIVLVFSRYSSSTAQNYHFNTFFVPKYQIAAHGGCGHTFTMTTDGTFGVFAAKYLYLHDTYIAGNANNEASGTGACGITYANNGFVLRYVIGV